MGFADERDAILRLDPVNDNRWNGTLNPHLVAPTGVSNRQAFEAALSIAELSQGVNGWDPLEACGLIPYKSGKRKKSPAEHSPVNPIKLPGQ